MSGESHHQGLYGRHPTYRWRCEDFLYVFKPGLTGRAARPERARRRSRSAPLGAPARAEALNG
ncbi:MAG: hypothetical protein LC799_18945 [Actinobacteria bacterium]|nr:hypothetical protein [Actinomycetota bacterium]